MTTTMQTLDAAPPVVAPDNRPPGIEEGLTDSRPVGPSSPLDDRLASIEDSLARIETTLGLVLRVLDAAGRAYKPVRRILDAVTSSTQ